ncbi:hypothetical protein CKO51_16795 [Rhodopirellula sp. SM50]|nr:hypothetical protein [Rhodopirellula sp. SM50]PAY18354.1 hypothetical protein CKO51_16795 [Rhodopirellula sp. SM50]
MNAAYVRVAIGVVYAFLVSQVNSATFRHVSLNATPFDSIRPLNDVESVKKFGGQKMKSFARGRQILFVGPPNETVNRQLRFNTAFVIASH